MSYSSVIRNLTKRLLVCYGVRVATILILFGLSLCLNLIMIKFLSNTSTSELETKEVNNPTTHTEYFSSVTRKRWESDNPDFVSQIVTADKPVVLYDTPLEKEWPAFDKWDYDYFDELFGDSKLKFVHSPNPVMWRFSDQYHWPFITPLHKEEYITFSEFRELMKEPEEYGWYYYSNSLKNIGHKIKNDISAKDLSPPHSKDISTLIWMGSAGVTSQCHVDHSQNFYFQVRGHKRFFLIPRHAWKNLHLMPRNHPHERRCNLPLADMDEETRQTLIKAGAMEVTLERGDLLYIPPLTAHHVTNIDSGISVNVWTNSPQSKVIDQNLSQLMPKLDNSLSEEEGLSLIITYFRKLFREMDVDITDWMKEHYNTRYHPLFVSDYYKSAENESFRKKCTGKLVPPTNNQLKMMDEYVEKVSKNILSLPKGTKDIHFGDYIDVVTYQLIVGPNHNKMAAPNTLYFIKYCFP